ncbi:MAG TPA: transglycosylase SLT domain-containing protein [Bdellovibrionota bacterium]|jgi:soluble lytic murein transglycosylase-like protein|nr:transglycosylase SLT domain-containing protein [Bdellovibrionota bacterium]
MRALPGLLFSATLITLPIPRAAASVELTKSEALEKCYRFEANKSPQWVRTCGSWEEFAKLVEKKITPEHRLLYARLAVEELKRLRDNTLVVPSAGSLRPFGPPVLVADPSQESLLGDLQRGDLFAPLSSLERGQEIELMDDIDQREPRGEAVEGEFMAASAPLLAQVVQWLRPLDIKGNVLQSDAVFVNLMAHGESMRFEKVHEIIRGRWRELSTSSLRQREIYQRIAYWTRSFGAIPLREWFYAEMMKVRPAKITGRRTIELFYYLESLRLAQPNQDSAVAVETTLKTLRSLWVVHTSKEERADIEAFVSSLRLRSKFRPPTLDSLSVDELILQAQSYVRRLDGESALRTVSQILADSHRDKITDDNLWETFQLHIRILRIMDRRPEIPELINAYSSRGGYLKLSKDTTNKEKSARRVFEIAKLEWTYGSHGRALGLLQRVQTFHKEFPLSKALQAELLYVKSRIMEQGKEKDIAELIISDALATKTLNREQEYDLRWRLFFLRINAAYVKKNFAGLEAGLAAIEPLTSDAYEKLRVNFWRGTLALYQENKELAKEQLQKVYNAEPMSYYGNLSALSLQSLGVELKNYLKPAEKEIKEPKWSTYVKDDGTVTDSAYRHMGRVIMLRRAGADDWVSEALDDLSSQLWTFVPSAKSGALAKRLDYARSTMWLFTHVGEPMSALRAADIVVTTLKEESPYDLKFLYPLAFWDDIVKYSADQKVDPWFAVSLIRQESAFKVNARSWANALGLMQMIPPVAKNEAALMGLKDFDYESLLSDPQLSVRLGTHHLGGLVKRFRGSWMCVLAGYNAGFPPVLDWLKYYPSPIPLTFVERISYTETRLYVMTIFRNFMNYQRIHGEGKISFAELNQIPR